MNTKHIHQIRTAAYAAVVALVAASTASPAFAEHTNADGEGGSSTATVSPYGRPIAALSGISFAQYLEWHQAGDPRTATVV